MSEENFNETMLDVFIFEINKHLESLETQVLQNEKNSCFTKESINEIFRSMHTIKGSAAMMLFDNISTLSHSVEDVFYFLREQTSENMDCSNISDMVLESVDFIRAEVEKIKNGEKSDGDASELIAEIDMFLTLLKQDNGVVEKKEQTVNNPAQQFYIPPEPKQNTVDVNHYEAKIRFDDDCGMENIRAYNLIHKVLEFTDDVHHVPDKILENDESSKIIKENGFTVYINTNQNYAELYETLMQTAFLKSLELHELDSSEISVKQIDLGDVTEPDMTIKIPVLSAKVKVKFTEDVRESTSMSGQSMISVSVNK